MNEEYARYLALQYGPGVAERYRAIASSPKPVRFPKEIPSEQICPECGKSFSNRVRKYCSKKCSKKAISRRQKDLSRKRKPVKVGLL
jgi:hypothetical protein